MDGEERPGLRRRERKGRVARGLSWRSSKTAACRPANPRAAWPHSTGHCQCWISLTRAASPIPPHRPYRRPAGRGRPPPGPARPRRIFRPGAATGGMASGAPSPTKPTLCACPLSLSSRKKLPFLGLYRKEVCTRRDADARRRSRGAGLVAPRYISLGVFRRSFLFLVVVSGDCASVLSSSEQPVLPDVWERVFLPCAEASVAYP